MGKMVRCCRIDLRRFGDLNEKEMRNYIKNALLNAGFDLDKEYMWSDVAYKFDTRLYKQYYEEDNNGR